MSPGRTTGQIWLSVAAERELALECLRLPETVAGSAKTLQPNEIAEYAFGLAKKFSRLYDECPVLAESDPNVRASRLALCSAAHAVYHEPYGFSESTCLSACSAERPAADMPRYNELVRNGEWSRIGCGHLPQAPALT
jgi:hypothetical protein